MNIKLRGHHLLCLPGFRGMGYSPAFAENMRRVYETLRKTPDTAVVIVAGADDLCRSYPCDKPNHCDQSGVHARDAVVLRHLRLQTGDCLPWREIQMRIGERVRPEQLSLWCDGCPWLHFGVCEQGVRLIAAGGELPPLPGFRGESCELSGFDKKIKRIEKIKK